MPFSINFSTTPGFSVLGPCVQMIFVFFNICYYPHQESFTMNLILHPLFATLKPKSPLYGKEIIFRKIHVIYCFCYSV